MAEQIVDKSKDIDPTKIVYKTFKTEEDLQTIVNMISVELSEPYPIYTYRYFLQKWPDLAFLAFYEDKCLGCVVSKLEMHHKPYSRYPPKKRGYIAMLAVDPQYRRLGLGKY